MKQKLKRFMAGFMAMLTLVGTLFTNGTTAFAASPQANIAFWNASVKNSGEVSELKPGFNHGKILYSILDGNSAYCMNFGLRADGGQLMNSYDDASTSMSAQQRKLLSYCLYYGFNSTQKAAPSNSQCDEYIATQAMVWVIVADIFGTGSGDSAARKLCNTAPSPDSSYSYYERLSEYREGSFVWADMIKRDLDACILQANDFSGFLELLSEKGYEVKQGKYLAVRPQGMIRFRRCKTLGENYSQEAIVERIAKEDLSFYQSQNEEKQAAIVKCYVKRYRRAKMSGLQKRYYAKLYRIGKLKKKPYSQVWKYKDDIRKMNKLQEQYLFLVRHKIESAEELVSVLDNLTDKKKEASKEKSKTYKAKERFKDIFDKAEQIRGLDDAESCYQSGDTFFEDEHNAWERLNTELLAQGYSVEEVESIRKKYESKYAQDCKAERAVSKELNLGRSIWKELTVSASAEEKQYDKETIRDRKEQPVR